LHRLIQSSGWSLDDELMPLALLPQCEAFIVACSIFVFAGCAGEDWLGVFGIRYIHHFTGRWPQSQCIVENGSSILAAQSLRLAQFEK
jgi:hypothetical protein